MMAFRVAFDYHAIRVARRDTLGQVRAWKLFDVAPAPESTLKGWSSAEREIARTFAAFNWESGHSWSRQIRHNQQQDVGGG